MHRSRYREAVDGTPFGRYRPIELLGRGGMGEVWRAHDSTIDRVVALKMLLPHFAEDATFEQRFRSEARAAARLDNPHVVPIYDVGELDGRLYVTMRLITGTDLQTLLDTGPLEADRAVAIVEQIASALHNAPPPTTKRALTRGESFDGFQLALGFSGRIWLGATRPGRPR
jgi:serine/threonine protein kinase